MSGTLQLGPLALPLSLLVVLVAAGVALYLGRRLAGDAASDLEGQLWLCFLAGLLVSRLAFVLQFHASYFASPLDILDIRDGGWRPVTGFVGAALVAFLRLMKKPALRRPLWSALAVAAVIWGAGTFAISVTTGTRQELPAISFTSLEGQPVQLADFKGKPTVLNLWATWCPPCVREMPVLQKAQADHPGVNFVFIDAGESPQRVSAWLQSRQLPIRNVLLDPKGEAGTVFNARGLPTTLFFDAQGRLASVRTGELSAATLQERLRAISD